LTHKIITTKDGSHSIFVPALNEHYHSTHGAIRESEHVFVQAGLVAALARFADVPVLNILEIGFGTGLNALLTYLHTSALPSSLSPLFTTRINYASIEAYPLPLTTVKQLNYCAQLQAPEHQSLFETLHTCSWDEPVVISPHFTLHKQQLFIEELAYSPQFHLVYFDAFAPNIQPALWTNEVLTRIYQAMLPNAILTTYCAKGSVKRCLKTIGFSVERLAGPPGKREMTRAVKAATP